MSVHSPKKRLALAVILPALELFLRLFHRTRSIDPTTPLRRILVFRPDHIGDAIMATALLRPLREKYPDAHIALCVGPWSRDLFQNHPAIDELIIADLPWWAKVRARVTNTSSGLSPAALVARLWRHPFDLFLDVRSDLRHILIGLLGRSRYIIAYNRTGADAALSAAVAYHSREHEVIKAVRLLEPLGIRVPDPALYLPVRDSSRDSLAEKLRAAGALSGAPIITLCPQTRIRVKEWPDAHWQQLARGLLAQTPPDLLIAVAGDKSLSFPVPPDLAARFLLFPGLLTLSELAALFEHSRLVIGSDSAPLHLAACGSTPIIALFGPTYPGVYSPFSKHLTLLTGHCVCNRDLHLDCDVNPGGPGRCMADIIPIRVLESIPAGIFSTTA
jgi:heptosyltransferase-2/heptosyltransferase-3